MWRAFLLLAAAFGTAAQDQVARQAMMMEGSFVRDARGDDASLLALVGQQLYNDAAREKRALAPRAAALMPPLVQAIETRNYNQAWRLGARFVVFARGREFGDADEAAASLDFVLDHRILAPGGVLHARLEPLYTLGRALRKPVTAEISFGGVTRKLTVETLTADEVAFPTKGLATGVHAARYRLLDGDRVLAAVSRDVLVDGAVLARAAALRRQAAQVGGDVTVEYLTGLVESAAGAYVGSLNDTLHPLAETVREGALPVYSGPFLKPERDLAQAERFLAARKEGKNPLAGAQGDFRMAFRSPADNTLQPYRLFLPGISDEPRPVVVALHGALGDENSYFERYLVPGGNESLMQKLARERGYIVICPAGRGTVHMYRGQSEQDVLDAIEAVAALVPIDRAAIFLTGHSMGSFGTLQIGTRFAPRFAGLAAVAGVPTSDAMDMAQSEQARLRLYQGGQDNITVPANAKGFADLARYRFADFAYILHEDDDHFRIAITTMPEIFDFFDKIRASKP